MQCALYIIRPNSHMKGTFSEKIKYLIYQLNILNNVKFMYRNSIKTVPAVFNPSFQRPSHSHPTNLSESNYLLPAHNLKKSKFKISIRGPLL